MSILGDKRLVPKKSADLYIHLFSGWLSQTIDCIDYVTGIGNAHAHNGVHSVLRLG